jgi:DNA-binding transcriptional MerR regulator
MVVLGAAEKSPEAFRTISEVAAELDVPQHVLRFWESKFVAIKPLKRGGGRRYYRREDLDLLRGIRSLLYSDGMTIKGVQKIFRDHGARYVMELGRGATRLVNAGSSALPAVPTQPVAARPRRTVAEDEEPGFGLTDMERMRFTLLLDELLELKARLKAARRGPRISQA